MAGAVALSLLAAATPLCASEGHQLRQFGLEGAWAVDCGADPGSTNPYLVFRVTPQGGAVRELIMRSSAADGIFDLTGLYSVSDVRIGFRDRRQGGGTSHDVIMQLQAGRLRSITSTSEAGTRLIENGIMVGSGQPSLQFQKCAKEPTV